MKLLSILVVFAFITVSGAADVGPNWVEQSGIRWTFNKNISLDGSGDTYRYGQFVNGDYWVIGPVRIVAISPLSRATVSGDTDESGRNYPVGTIVNGSMINPPIAAHIHGYTSGASSGWTPELNVAWGINAQNPLVLQAHSSLISTVSRNDPGSGNRSSVQRAAILTVLPTGAFDHLPPGINPADCFRPAYIGTTKTVRHWKQQLDYSFLQQLAPVGSGIPSLSAMEEQFKRPWIRKALGWTSRFIHPLDSMPDYYMVLATNNGALALNLNYSNQQKETLLVYYSQLGIDLYGPYEAGSRGNGPDGGVFPGLLLPMLVAGRALNYSPMLNICQQSGNYINSPKPGGGQYGPGDVPPDYLYIQELCQTFYVTQREIDITQNNHSIPWTPSGISLNWDGWDINGGSYVLGAPYGTGDMGLPDYGIRHSTSPGWTTKHWDVFKNYRGQNSPYYTQTAFLMLAMGLKNHVNHNAFFDYTDRWASIRGQSAMRATYRQNYGPIWPDTQEGSTSYTLSIFASGGTVTRSPNKSAYDPGETVTLTATANAGYTFTGWSGTLTGTANPITIVMDGNRSVTANFVQNAHTLTITSAHGTVVKSPDKVSYTHGETITLTATPNAGYTFANWSGSVTGTANPVTITMDGNKSVTANYTQNTFALTIETANGTATKTPDKAGYSHGETVKLTAVPDSGYSFVNWTSSDIAVDTKLYQSDTAMSFDGIDNYVSIPTNGWKFDGTTVTLWAMPRTVSESHYLFGHTVGGWDSRIQLYIRNGQLGLGLGNTHALHQNIDTLQSGQWYFVALSFANGTYQVYVNSTLRAAGNYTGLTQFNTFADIGNTGNVDFRNIEAFDGTIEDVRIFASVLSIDKIQSMAEQGRNGHISTPDNPLVITIDGNKSITANFTQSATPTPNYTLGITATNGSVTARVNGVVTTATSFAHGTVVSLTAAANTSYTFANWSGSATGTANPVSITMDGNKAVTANFTQNTYTLATAAANGTVAKSPYKTSYTHGETVTLTATANSGYTFSGWSGSVSGTANPITITMDGNKSVTANFTQNSYTLATTATNGTVAKSPNKTSYAHGETVILTATANTGYTFSGWSGSAAGTVNPVTITMDGNKSVSADFTQNSYNLATTATNGMIAKSPNKTSYTHGDSVALTATANTGYTFSGWSGSVTGTANPVTIIMDGNKTVTADFTQSGYTLTVTATNGTVTKSPDKVAYAYGETVTLTAAPNTGYTFSGWSGSAAGTANPVTITMDGNKAVTAGFTQNPESADPVAHWLFNQPYESTVLDAYAELAASLINDPEWGEGWAEEYFVRLNSSNQAVQVPMSQCNPQSGTVALWVQPQTSDGTQYLFGHTLNSANRIALYTVNGNLTLGLGSQAVLRQNIAALSLNLQYHIVLTWNNGSYAVFVNGQQAATGSYSGLDNLHTYADVGNYGSPDSRTIGFRGLVQDVQLYARALNAEEIKALMLTHYVKENRSIEFVISGLGNQGNPISYTASNLPQGASFDVATQTFSWLPSLYNSAGRYDVHFTADGHPSQTVTVFVQEVTLSDWYKSFLEHIGKN